MTRFMKALALAGLLAGRSAAADADLILHNGKVATVDREFRIARAVAVAGGRIVRVGTDAEVLSLRGTKTEVIDLGGKFVLPGLIDSHVHALGAAMHEFDHPVPDMGSVADVLSYVRGRAAALPGGSWVVVRQVFITRLKEQRYPTRAELDEAAPGHPVLFSTGPDASVNTLALKLSGIGKGFKVSDGGTGFAETDLATGEPTGILRNCTRYVKAPAGGGRAATDDDRRRRLRELFSDYNAVGLTGALDRNADPAALDLFQSLLDRGELTVRLAASHSLPAVGSLDAVRDAVKKAAAHPLRTGGPMLRVIGVKAFLDGGMLTGSAYMRQPWGVSRIYSITDPGYRGVLFLPPERLAAVVRATAEAGLQFTAHAVGDGAVHALLNAYEEVGRDVPLRPTRPCLTHANFMTPEDIARAARLGVAADVQPVWLYLDAHTLAAQFGDDRLRSFQPLKSLFAAGVLVGGGSDHMQKVGSLRSVNPYNPFLGMHTAVTRTARHRNEPLHSGEALTREQVVRFYTINNARLMFLEDQVGSLEAGKLADLTVLDRDLLTCPADEIKATRCVRTYVNGRLVYERK